MFEEILTILSKSSLSNNKILFKSINKFEVPEFVYGSKKSFIVIKAHRTLAKTIQMRFDFLGWEYFEDLAFKHFLI